MNSIAIIPEFDAGGTKFRAVSGSMQSTGNTMGEALDSLNAAMGESGSKAVVILQHNESDQFFTATQQQRMKNLMARRGQLSEAERSELQELVFSEIDATVARTDSFVNQQNT